MTAVAASDFTSYRGDNRSVFVVRPAAPTTKTARLSTRYESKTRNCHCTHWAPDDGRETPETCWAVIKRQDNKLEHWRICLMIYLNCAMMHGLTNLKSKLSSPTPQNQKSLLHLFEHRQKCRYTHMLEQRVFHFYCIMKLYSDERI
jgi:hypothetical protein